MSSFGFDTTKDYVCGYCRSRIHYLNYRWVHDFKPDGVHLSNYELSPGMMDDYINGKKSGIG